ncbi:uncharacterized protein LOC121735360 [Aricia agestis]|uniref:uncharacterized protein LOC121735360 n=1 Tax=Aricia agestis TaxID=91739 RepID=UPI001C204FE1|nr:uncharacterized protein LOC121735360 [Aricia agestis]
MEKSWLLVEWIQKDILSASFDVVNAKCLEGNKQDVCVGKLSILREKYSNNTRPGKVLYISDDKQFLKGIKSMLMRMTEQMKTTVEMFNNTINQMKTELMSDCDRVRAKGKVNITNRDYDLNSKKRKVKSTIDNDTQTEQRYSPEFINDLRTSLKTGYEELTTIVFSMKEGNLNETNENLITNKSELMKKSKRVSDDDVSANAGPIKKKLRAWNELHIDTKKEKMKTLKSPYTCTSMRQYVNRKVLSPIQHNEMVMKDNDTNINDNNIKNMPVPENKENEEIMQPENNNIYNFTDSHESNLGSTASQSKGDMVPIGSGNTLIPKTLYESLNWNSYTNVTRKLLQILFSREVLSTHSLSGKRSPAFSNKPAKKQLNPITVDDIVATVAKKCDIKESFVRTCITVKCADEAKMLRQRNSRTSIKSEQNDSSVKESSIQIDESLQC